MFLHGDLLIARAIQTELLSGTRTPDTALRELASRLERESRRRPASLPDQDPVCPSCHQPITRAAS